MKNFFSIAIAFTAIFCCNAELLPLGPGESLIPLGEETEKLWTAKTSGEMKSKVTYQYGRYIIFYFRNTDNRTKSKLVISRNLENLPCDGFDQFVVWVNNTGHKITVKLQAVTDKGLISAKPLEISGIYSDSFTDLKLDLQGAKYIRKIYLECVFPDKQLTATSFNIHRLILRNKSEFTAWVNYWKRFDSIKWEGLIKDESYQPSYKLKYGMLFSQNDLEQWRKKNPAACRKSSWPSPESGIVPNFGRPRGYVYQRITASGSRPEYNVGNIAFQAMLCKDKELMRLAARYLLSLCAITEWGDSYYPETVGNGVITAFNNGTSGFRAAFAFDCVGEMLTGKGRAYVLKMMMYKAFMPVTYSEWSRPQCFKYNQGPSFIRGKLASLLIAERNWQRVRPYTDLAKAELDEVVKFLFKEDGSYMEASASYMQYSIKCMAQPYQAFSSMRKEKLNKVVPVNVGKSGAMAQLISSSCKHPGREIVSFGQGHTMENLSPSCLGFMAMACSESMWVNLFNKYAMHDLEKLCRSTFMGSGVGFSKYYEQIKKLKNVEPKPFIMLKYCGLSSSWRKAADGNLTKLVIIGDAAQVGKKHNDVGSFILEYAGDIFALDMPVYAGFMGAAEYHNMLVAIDENGKLANSMRYTDPSIRDKAALRNSMTPKAHGDKQKFHAVVDASKSWEQKYFKSWIRTFDSPAPDELTITDEYMLGEKATGAAFIWITYLPCKKVGNKVIINGEYGSKCEIAMPKGCKVDIKSFNPGNKVLKGMALPSDHCCTRIIIKKTGRTNEKNTLKLKLKLKKQ